MKRKPILSSIIYIFTISACCGEMRKFPKNFMFGVGTASYQIEGGWNASDKGENIWDRLTHTTKLVKDASTGDVACDSYHKTDRDVEMLKELGVNYYRFSISWSRILPEGFDNKISGDGIAYYDRLIDSLISAEIVPMVTLFHWDLPQPIQELGGWANPLIVNYIRDYANVIFKKYGDKVKSWITINEPASICLEGYGLKMKAPALGMAGIADYLCAHHVIKAHAAIYHLYNNKYRNKQKGRVGIAINTGWMEPKTKSKADIEAANRAMEFILGLYANPIFSKRGDYPKIVKERIAKISALQGYSRSRLPKFTQKETDYIRGTYDFFGLNHYTTHMAENPFDQEDYNVYLTLPVTDMHVNIYQEKSWPTSASFWLKVVPWGFTKLLKWIKDRYDNPEVIITENGFSDRDRIDDYTRVDYHKRYLNAMLDAIDDGCNVTGYMLWSLMDNFEWMEGYTERFGLYYVDFNDPNRKRTPKQSAFYYKNITSSRSIERV